MTDIVVGVDGSDSSDLALAWAVREGELRGWTVTAVMAWDYLDQHHAEPPANRFESSYTERDAAAALAAYIERAVGPRLAGSVQREVTCDRATQALLAASEGASLLVVGARGLGGFRGLLLGSVSQRCLNHATCPVAIVRGEPDERPPATERIVVGIDGSETSRAALRWAAEEARARQATLHVVHAWQMPYAGGYPLGAATAFDPLEMEDGARSVLEGAIEQLDVADLLHPVEHSLVGGGAAGALLDASKGADLVVVGSRGLGGFTGMLIGSVSHHVAVHATSPVVIVPPER